MKKLFNFCTSIYFVNVLAISIFVTQIWAKFISNFDPLYSDPFHHGEYVTALQFVIAGNLNFFTIHGAMDWIPAFFSQTLFGLGQLFLPTTLTYTALEILASVLLFSIVYLMTDKHNQYRTIILILSAFLVSSLVSARDAFLLITILVFFLSQKCMSNPCRNILAIVLGITLALNLLWSFDRGVAGIAAIGLACLILMIKQKHYLLTFASFIATILVLNYIGALSFQNYIANFQFLLATSSQWGYGFTKHPVILTALTTIPNGWAIYFLLKQLRLTIGNNLDASANLVCLIILTILMYKVGTNRADVTHVLMALWAPALSFLYLHEKFHVKWPLVFNVTITISIILLARKTHVPLMYLVALIPALYVVQAKLPRLENVSLLNKSVIVLFAIPMLIFSLFNLFSQPSKNDNLWQSQSLYTTTNQSLVSDRINWVSSEILNAGSTCIFDFSNNGVINGITGLQACTKYLYPIYATQAYEADMLEELMQHNPPVVVFSSDVWSFNIDGKSMHDRLPKITQYLLKNYPYEQCNYGYCLRYMNQPSEKVNE